MSALDEMVDAISLDDLCDDDFQDASSATSADSLDDILSGALETIKPPSTDEIFERVMDSVSPGGMGSAENLAVLKKLFGDVVRKDIAATVQNEPEYDEAVHTNTKKFVETN